MTRLGLSILVVIAIAKTPSEAAVRVCGATISVGPFAAPTELEAKKQALDAWKAEAAKLGKRYAGWGIAADRSLTCRPAQGAQTKQVSCTAAATPCTIEQAPNTLESRSKRLGI